MQKFFLALLFILFLSQTYSISNTKCPLEKKYVKQADLLLKLADSLCKEGQVNYAIEKYELYRDLYPQSKKINYVLNKLAFLWEKKQYYLQASNYYLQIYQQNGNSLIGLKAHFEYARLQELMGYNEQANKIYKHIIQVDANSMVAQKAKSRLKLYSIFKDNQ